MEHVYESIMTGLAEAIEDAQSKEKHLQRRIAAVMPVKTYNAKEIQHIRKKTGLSQKLFAGYMGVSAKTVEAWEAGTNHPSGTAGGNRNSGQRHSRNPRPEGRGNPR